MTLDIHGVQPDEGGSPMTWLDDVHRFPISLFFSLILFLAPTAFLGLVQLKHRESGCLKLKPVWPSHFSSEIKHEHASADCLWAL